MRLQILKRPQAERDIEECFVYIAEKNLDAGVSFLAAVEESLDRIAEFPHIGTVREFTTSTFKNIRMRNVSKYGNYLIFYEAFVDRIEVVRVLHGSRDIKALFGVED